MKKTISIILTLALSLALFVFVPSASASSVSSKTAGVVSISGGWLNVRSSASSSSSVSATLSDNCYVTLISKSGDWWYVEYGKNLYGYCHSNYITPVSGTAATVNITSGSLNVRSGAGSTHEKIGSLTKGETVIVLSKQGNWSYVLYHGRRLGYVSSTYLTSSATTAYPSVKLSVPSYKQTDRRWANVTLGSSGKTIGQIGCATTGIAMLESFRLGYTIYPDTMSKRLKYTSSGSVYWPSHYSQVSSQSGYLGKIYNLLKQGKPVLFGAKNRYGSQHWVVITGYVGGSTLSASGFTVNDPGSSNRTTLQDLFNTHPNFYKYLYY